LMLAIILEPGAVIPARKQRSSSGDDAADEEPEADLVVETETFAGLAGLTTPTSDAATSNLTADMGQLLLPRFHRTFVGTHANGLLLHHLLDAPTDPIPGLGLRRVQWQPNASNTASVNAAQRLGFKLEGVMRWAVVLPWGKVGDQVREGREQGETDGRKARHTAMLALCWDDWEGGGRERVDRLMAR
jgi:RimJ/RimL family protein N-acetyltransferase